MNDFLLIDDTVIKLTVAALAFATAGGLAWVLIEARRLADGE